MPGRICLFGEHSDWAAGYRRINSKIEKGYTIICGTNQGMYARIAPHENELIFRSTDAKGKSRSKRFPMDPQSLLRTAEVGDFWSYVAGVAYQVMIHYHTKGLEIDNYKTDLPMKKGLSSSAAVCVLVSRAFNRMYDLKMTTRGEMDMAYRGEITTPSRCGRMDQGCAYGNRPILMTYDAEAITVEEIAIPKELHYVIADLKAGKDTIRILGKLNKAYPFADDEMQRRIQEYLGPTNKQITNLAVDAMERADLGKLGRLMNKAQLKFDEVLAPACPAELNAPMLHRVLQDNRVKAFALGGKCVGSGGDGAVQFLTANADSQITLVRYLEDSLGLECLKLTIPKLK